MPRPAHTLITFSGVIHNGGAGLEEWQIGLRTPAGDTTGLNLQPFAEVAKSCWSANISPLLNDWIRLTRVRYALVGSDGLVTRDNGGAYRQADAAANENGGVIGGTGRQRLSASTALVVSLQTDRSGPTGKGRVFLPYPGFGMGADFRIAQDAADLVATNFAEFVRDLSQISEPVAVVSSKGYSSTVTSVRVGRVPDVLRSRRHRLVEAYSVSEV